MDRNRKNGGAPEQRDNSRDDLKGKVLRLRDLVQYRDGTVASRMIVFRKGGNVTICAVEENEGLPEHSAPFDALVSVLEGVCSVRVGDAGHEMKEGDSIIFPAGIPHSLTARTRFKMTVTMIRD